MLYYRYRSGSELSIKELIYDEFYFASGAENNDPYEGKLFALLDKNEECWNNLIRLALKFYNGNSTVEYLIKRVISFCVSKAPLYLDEFTRIPQSEFVDLGKGDLEKIILSNMLLAIKQFVSIYLPTEQYFACFSKRSDNYLMWSHYANNHTGFCLVFRAINGKLRQNQNWIKKNISYITPKSFSPQMSFTIPDGFEFRDVEYVTEPKYLDGFMCFPASVVQDRYTPAEIAEFQEEYNKSYLQKHKVWDYEQEARIVLSSGIPWLTGEKLSLTPHQRLFHYEPTQLVGIIIGSRSSSAQRNRIQEIVAEKVERWYLPVEGERIISDFVVFEERLSETNREVQIEPIKIYGCACSIDNTDPDFQKRYEAWESGSALKFTDDKVIRIQL